MWTSQSYIETGLSNDIKIELLQESAKQIFQAQSSLPQRPSLLTLRHFVQRTNSDYNLMRSIVKRSDHNYYKKFSIRKRSGGKRFIYVPNYELMVSLKWLNLYVLNLYSPHHASHAFVKKRSIVSCAAPHCGTKWLVKIDITGFFESITEIQIYRVFKSLGYSPLVSFELARICTVIPKGSGGVRSEKSNWEINENTYSINAYSQGRKILGFLPQGYPTSPVLSNLVMRDLDEKIQKKSDELGITYTRYSDDMIFSTSDVRFNREILSNFIGEISTLIGKQGFSPNQNKTKIIPPGSRKVVLGLNVNASKPSLSKEFKSKIRMHLFYLSKPDGVLIHSEKRGFKSILGMRNHIEGLINYARMVDVEYGIKMMTKLNSIRFPDDINP